MLICLLTKQPRSLARSYDVPTCMHFESRLGPQAVLTEDSSRVHLILRENAWFRTRLDRDDFLFMPFQFVIHQPPTTSVFPHIVPRIQADDCRPDVVMQFCDIAITSSRHVVPLISRSNFSMHKKRKMGVVTLTTDLLMQW
jgi:hypothetical protein